MKPELMDQSVCNVWRPLCDFPWDLTNAGTRQDRNPNKQAQPSCYNWVMNKETALA